ncbi:MAG TPA: Rieske 2Fe-2S domain-containing protein [Gemmataceae bacterium]|nr:Rieske 2Fe-2S domain-containing protein [Gemmataceae bacterium]
MALSLLEKIELFDPNLPLAEARTIPSVWYFDPEVHAAERSSVFAGTWQQIGRLDQLAEPGSFVTEDVAGEPILVVRDQERTLRAFSNVCRHRAARVARERQGRSAGCATGIMAGLTTWPAGCAARRSSTGSPIFAAKIKAWCRCR